MLTTRAPYQPLLGGVICLVATSLAPAAPESAGQHGTAAERVADTLPQSLRWNELRADAPTPQGPLGSSAPETATLAGAPPGLERLGELNLLSDALIAKAASGSAPAHEFRIEARMYRELLRQTMLADRERPANQQLPQPLLLDMVRMSALLHAAADCKTGLVITCPADLMLQLRSQQTRVAQELKMIELTRE